MTDYSDTQQGNQQDLTEGRPAQHWAQAFHDMSERAAELKRQRDRACQIVNARDTDIARLREAIEDTLNYGHGWAADECSSSDLCESFVRLEAALSRPAEEATP